MSIEGVHAAADEIARLEREADVLRKQNVTMNKMIAKQTNALTHARATLTRISEYDSFGGYQGAMFLARGAIGQIDEAMKTADSARHADRIEETQCLMLAPFVDRLLGILVLRGLITQSEVDALDEVKATTEPPK